MQGDVPTSAIVESGQPLVREIRCGFCTTLEKTTVDQPGIHRISRHVIYCIDMATQAILEHLIDLKMEALHNWLTDELLLVRRILWILNDSVTESIRTGLRMANQGPEALSPSPVDAVSNTLLGDGMS